MRNYRLLLVPLMASLSVSIPSAPLSAAPGLQSTQAAAVASYRMEVQLTPGQDRSGN